MQRGQSSVELLMVLIISLTILAALISFTTTHVSNLEKQHSIDVAQDSINRLVREINNVYLLGPGKVREVVIPFPSGIDAANSRLQNNGIILRVYDTDVSGTAIPSLQGSVPTSEGLLRIRLLSYADHVTISLVSLLADKDTVYVPMARDSNESVDVTLTSYYSNDVNVTYTLTWSHTLVGASVSPASQIISPSGSATVDLDFSAGATAQGNYVGYLVANATTKSGTEQLTIPVNVEVFAPANTLLTVIPSTISLSTLGADTNYATIQVCNSGSTAIKSISFTPTSQTPGTWVSPISTIASLAGSSCQDVNVTITVAAGTSSGTYTGAISVADFTGANSTILGLYAHVQTMADYFTWVWPTVFVATQGGYSTSIGGMVLHNSATTPITMSELIIRGWWVCDVNHSAITNVTFNNQSLFTGTANDGNTINITDFNVPAQSSLSVGNAITFSNYIDDAGQQFLPIVTFSDTSTYTGPVLGPGCAADTIAPGAPNSFTASAGPSPETVSLQWTFPGDDNQTGLVSSVDIRFAHTPITTEAQFLNAFSIPYTGSILPAGSSGTQLVSDLNVGQTYYFSIMFFDEVDNNSGISNSPGGRPHNRYQYSLHDMNATPFAFSFNPSVPGSLDVNVFDLNAFVIGSGDRNIYIHVFDDYNFSNNWYLALGFPSVRLRSVRIWYPAPRTEGLPTDAPQYTGDPNWGYTITGINLLSPTIFPTEYRFNGSLVSFPYPSRLKFELLQGFSDVNLTFDQNTG